MADIIRAVGELDTSGFTSEMRDAVTVLCAYGCIISMPAFGVGKDELRELTRIFLPAQIVVRNIEAQRAGRSTLIFERVDL